MAYHSSTGGRAGCASSSGENGEGPREGGVNIAKNIGEKEDEMHYMYFYLELHRQA